MVGVVSAYIEHFTYLGLLVFLILCGLGLPMPEDVALLAGGFLVHRGVIRYPITLAVALVGVVTGDCSLFFLGRRFGTGLLSYFGLAQPNSMRLVRMREFMARYGSKAIFYARFLAGFRALVYLSAGTLGVPPAQFLLYDLMGALISVPVVVSLGYLFGSQLEGLLRFIGGAERALLIVAALSLLIWLTRVSVMSGPDPGQGKGPHPEVE